MVFIKGEEMDSCDGYIDEADNHSFHDELKQRHSGALDTDVLDSLELPAEARIEKPDVVDSDDDDSGADAASFSEAAMAWDGQDMEHLENIFNNMRAHFQSVVYVPEGSNGAPYDQDDIFQSEPEKCDLQDACCYFLEHENLPRIHQARANLMMVWLIETESESARYAQIAGEIIDTLDSDVVQMFGLRDARVEELEKELYAAQEEAVRRRVEADAEMSEYDDEEDDEEAG